MHLLLWLPRRFAFLALGLVLFTTPLVHAQVPVITAITAPRQVVARGQNLTLSVTATGATSYQWKRSGKPIAGATSASYTITAAQPVRDNGWYQVVVTNASGSVTSAVVFVNVSITTAQVWGWGDGTYSQTNIPAGLNAAIMVAGYHGGSLAVRPDGTLTGWGTVSGNFGLNNVVSTSNGASLHFLVLEANGTVTAWPGSGENNVPAGLSNVVSVAAGYSHSLALKADGTITAWGSATNGAIFVPSGLNNAIAVAAGNAFSLALRADGTVVGWGANDWGQSTPPAGLTNVVAIAAGDAFGAALRDNGTVAVWGLSLDPALPSLTDVVAISAGYRHLLALRSGGTVVAAGYNSFGANLPPQELNLVVGIGSGGYHSLAIRDSVGDLAPAITSQPANLTVFTGQDANFSVAVSAGTSPVRYQWRKNATNIVGATSPTLTVPRAAVANAGTYDVVISAPLGSVTSSGAVLTVNPTPGASIAGGQRQVVALGQPVTLTAATGLSGAVTYQWRLNGRVIPGATSATLTRSNLTRAMAGAYQVLVTGTASSALSDPVWVVVSGATQIVARGSNNYGEATVPSGLNNAVGVAAGTMHSLAVRSDGSVLAWGESAAGKTAVPSGLANVVQVTGGVSHSAALRADGSVVTWGNVNFTPPQATGVIRIASGGDSVLALKYDGSVVSWSSSGLDSDIPTGLVATAVAATVGSRMALRSDGTVAVISGPAAPSGLNNVVAIVGGFSHALALKADGTVVAWGSNDYGETNIPAGLNNVVYVAAGRMASYAMQADGTIVAWGDPSPGAAVVGTENMVEIAGGYHVLVLRDASTDTAPVITAQPVGATVQSGASITFSVTATGGSLSYRWRYDGTPIEGATGRTYFIGGVSVGGTFDVVVTNYLGSVTSAPATLLVGEMPYFNQHPQSSSVGLGGTVTLTFQGGGSTPVTRQWRKNGNPITGATGSTLTLTNFQASDNGVYTVALTNPVGTTISNGATLTAVTSFPPVITSQPVGGTLEPGNVGSFAVGVSSPYTYYAQWRKNGVPISGALASSLVLGPVQLSHSGVYDVVVTSIGGSVTSAPASLNVNSSSLAITSQPVATAVAVNTAASFSVTMSGTAPFSYQWRRNGVAISGATAATLTLPNAQTADAGVYSVVVTNSLGTITSNDAALTVLTAAPVISSQPLSTTVPVSNTVTFSVSATGGPLSYQWRKGGSPIGGANAASYTLFSVPLSAAGQYDVVVTNAFGSVTSSTATLTVTESPFFFSGPSSATVTQGQTATFTVTAGGTPAPTYQWQKNTVNISGANSTTLTLPNVQAADAATYRVQLSNSAGTVFSGNATLSVLTVPVITSQPGNISIDAGGNTSLGVTATGNPTPTYQWRKNGTNISGATSSSLGFNNILATAAGTYDVVVTNSVGSVTSTPAVVTVNTYPPTISTQPVGATIGVGTNYTFSVGVAGSPPFSYQWRLNGVPLPTATAPTLAIVNAQTSYTGNIDVVVTTPHGSVTSNAVRFDVVPRPIALSARVLVGGEPALGFFTVEGPAAKQLLVRAIGPGLASFAIDGLLADPQLEIFDSTGTLIAANDDWGAAPNVPAILSASGAVGAFGLANGSRDAVVLATFAPGTYTARAKGANGAGGVAFLELYDTDLLPGTSRIPFVAVRGRAASGDSVMIGGLGANGRGVRSYLLRAVGPTLGLPGQLVNPALFAVRDGLLVGSNDDWDAVPTDATAVNTATARVAAFPLPAGSRDAAIVLTGNLHNGAHLAQIAGPENTSGMVLLELHDLDAGRPASFAPVIVSPPAAQSVATGAPLTLKVLVHGTGPLAYQWRKQGVNLPGATGSTLTIPAVTTSDGGSYSVVVSNSLGSATSLPGVVTVQGTTSGLVATHAATSGGYLAGGTLTITNTLGFSGTASSLAWEVTLPAGWTFASDGGTAGDVKPAVGTSGKLEWAWTSPPASPVTFTYTVNIPAGESGDQTLSALAIVRSSTSSQVQTVAPSPNPLTISATPRFHAGDTSLDSRIGLIELTRMIELYNTRNGSVRTGAYALATTATEDGFDPAPTRAPNTAAALTRYHSADTRGATLGSPRDGAIGLLELTRVIELYNYRSGTSRTGEYHVAAGTEDGFAPGP